VRGRSSSAEEKPRKPGEGKDKGSLKRNEDEASEKIDQDVVEVTRQRGRQRSSRSRIFVQAQGNQRRQAAKGYTACRGGGKPNILRKLIKLKNDSWGAIGKNKP